MVDRGPPCRRTLNDCMHDRGRVSYPCVPHAHGVSSSATIFVGLCPKMKNVWKNHFCEIKGDVGMSHHEKERNKKMHRKSFITPSLHL